MAVTITIEVTASTTDDALMQIDAIRERIEQGFTSGEGFDVSGDEED